MAVFSQTDVSSNIMEPLIYYPTFEPPNENWLKFSLLYFEQFKPIVPYGKRHLISDNFRNIRDNTDLIELYSPEYNDSYKATLKSIEETEKILAKPYEKSFLFKEINLQRKWTNPANWNFEIYNEKFSHEWIHFCLENNIGRQTNNGILLAEELAFLYMTHLAKEISFSTNSAIITDDHKFDNFTSYQRGYVPAIEKRNKFAKSVINLLVPNNLKAISFDKLITFRNKNRELLKAFNNELLAVQNNISDGYSGQDFIDSYNSIYSELTKEIILLGIGVASIPFAAYLLLKNDTATNPEYIKEILGAIGVLFGGTYAIRKSLVDSKTKRYCKKYLTNLERIR